MSDTDPFDVTQDAEGNPLPRNVPVVHPQRIGRYRIEKILGQGGFGLVYLAHDEQLDRLVAVKVPHARLINKPEDAELYMTEARTAAGLDHPHIVPVYDVGSTEEFPCYIVSKYIEGTDLAARLKQSRLGYAASTALVATVADALHYAHKQGLVDRDVKPGNILLDQNNQPYVVDFGLALREADVGKGPRYAGSPAFMSPEQARGEGHRVDGRSDIYSLGSVFYELLTGRRTVTGKTQQELLEQIVSQEVKPPRQIDDRIPKELERICLKALAKRASDRYTTALDMAEDLRQWLNSQSALPADASSSVGEAFEGDSTRGVGGSGATKDNSSQGQDDSDSQAIKVVPKGLRSFDAHDADFFLELLPGPRDRDGLPDSIRFWKTRIEETDSDATFSVGLIYGPSGCGKSSLVKAGLLPRLSEGVIPIFIEATPEETEIRLLHGLRKRCPELEGNLSLKETLAALRRGQGIPAGQKVLIVLDQFEQWLHANKEVADAELVEALRQCNGGQAQCIVMVRDDFWMAVTRFLRELEVKLLEDHNLGAVDLFPQRHAQKVLAAFGRAFGALPGSASETSKDQREFLRESVLGLAEEGKVTCVRLALFAEMIKGKPWTLATLREVGGAKGIGVTFLDETFTSSAASPEHRYYQQSARAVLKSLLPESGTDIKGHMRSHTELLQASGYENRSEDFDDLIRILDSEIRLITPTDPEGKFADDDSLTKPTDPGQKYYQLTHDYLVHSLREWLTQKQKETRKGRAELALADRAAVWNARPENQQLPSLLHWLQIRWYTRAKDWTEPQQKMMNKAARVLGVRWGMTLAVMLVVVVSIRQYEATIRNRNRVERLGQAVEAMGNSPWYKVPDAISNLREFPRGMVIEKLEGALADAKPSQKLALNLALADYGQADLEFLLSQISGAPAVECTNLVNGLGHYKETALPRLSDLAGEADSKSDWKLKSRLAVIALHLGDVSIAVDIHKDRSDPTQQTVFIHDVFPTWHANLNQLAEVIDDAGNASLRAGMCLAMGNLPAEQVRDAREGLLELLSGWYSKATDSATHGAAAWAMRKWGATKLPNIAVDVTDPKDRDWKVTPVGRESGFTMVRIPAGQFRRTDGRTEQTVTLARDLWLSDVEVTVSLFQQFVNDEVYREINPNGQPSGWKGADRNISPSRQHPVQQVSWEDAVLFCNWLSWKEGRIPCYNVTPSLFRAVIRKSLHVTLRPDGNGYRLPTRAEWEYACRGGTATEFGFGPNEERLKHYAVFSTLQTEMVGDKMCNRWGLFDVHGNVWEWCFDWHSQYSRAQVENPTGPELGVNRVYLGGSWNYDATNCRSDSCHRLPPSYRYPNLGFRVAQGPLSAKLPASGAQSESR